MLLDCLICVLHTLKRIPQRETQAGKAIRRFFERKMNSTFSTNIRSDVTQI